MRSAKYSRKAGAILFILLFGTYAYFTHPASPALFNSNELVRYLLTKSIVHDGSVSIGRYSSSGLDMALYDGRYFSGKAPGLSAAAVPFYALVHAAAGDGLPDGTALYAVRLFTVSLPAALFALALLSFVRRLGPPEGLSRLLLVGYGLGTMAFAYAVVFMAHQPAAILVFLCFLTLLRWRRGGEKSAPLALGAGLLGGFAVAFEYPAAILVIVIALFAFFPFRRIGHILCFLLGLIPGAALVLGYNWACFGDPLSFPYAHEAMPAAKKVQSTGLFGVARPSIRVLFMLLVSPFRGLFFVSPFLILCIPGLFHMWTERRGAAKGSAEPTEARVGMSSTRLFSLSLAAAGCYLLFNSSYLAWSGGASYGPRHLVPAMPFLLIPIACLLRSHPREYFWPFVLLVAYSVVFSLVGVAGGPEAHEYLRNPVRESALLYVLTGNIRWNWGAALGLSGLVSLAPLGILWLACLCVLLGRAPMRREAAGRPLSLTGRLMRAASCLLACAMVALFFIHRTPERAYRYAVIGHGFDMRGDDERAAAYFERSLALDPRDPLVLNDYSLLAVRRGDYASALDLQMKLLALSPSRRNVMQRIEILFRLTEIAKRLKSEPDDAALLREKRTLEERLLSSR